ncbi:putative malate dehydrogenase 1B [Synchiropus splendidus]|uniref:putative malate dehydrogenase 1B n=1 Tax=Synchiropus splendidus TaxID=270530 RepID=UPI00237D37D1|nr:putative malate dehydrogenase 1B [Synchiropus splendidus]
MAKFVLAGKANCPWYAKAELLADSLVRSLPSFRIHKISILPDEWEKWLEDVCDKNEWSHQESPIIWRELVNQGGKGMLVGGLQDFLSHCEIYYNVKSDMSPELMTSIAAENLQTKINVLAEEALRLSLIKPLHIWISSALNPTSDILIPRLLSPEVFPQASVINIHLLDLRGTLEELNSLKMETEDLALPLLYQTTVHTDLEKAFQDADVILLLDEWWSEDVSGTKEGERRKEISDQYTVYGQLINTRARRDVKVVVSSGDFAHLRCCVLMSNASSIDSRQFVVMATQLQNEARAVIAKKLNVNDSDVHDVIVWGNVSREFYVDLQMARVYNYDGAIRGPRFYFQEVDLVLHDRKWLEAALHEIVRNRRTDVSSKTGRTAAMSAANGMLMLLKAWNSPSPSEGLLSVGVICSEQYSLPEGIVLSVPVTFADGMWSIFTDVTMGDELQDRLEMSAKQVEQERDIGKPLML